MSDPAVEVLFEEAGWRDALPELEALCEQAFEMAMRGLGLPPDRYAVAVLACNDARISELNAAFRDKPGPTNVLSWPAFELSANRPGGSPERPPVVASDSEQLHLGDVAISLETTQKEAERALIPLKDHVLHLILHGILHLLGYDHKIDAEARIMEGLESRLLAAAGLQDPYSRGDAAAPQSD